MFAADAKRFALVEFYLVAAACLVMALAPELGWGPLLLAAIPWFARLFWARLPFRKTYLDLPLLLFVLTAFIGVWAAYNAETALHKFYLILGAVLFFYSLANQPEANRWIIVLSLGGFGALTTAIFLWVTDWGQFQADLGLIQAAGRLLGHLQPGGAGGGETLRKMFSANMAGGVDALLLPLTAAAALHFRGEQAKSRLYLSLALLIFLAFGLLLSSSRAAWGATLLGLAVLGGWLHPKTAPHFSRKLVLLGVPAALILLGLLLPPALAATFSTPASPVTEVSSFASRIRIAGDTVFLIGDFPFTGGGLGSFPGLYSQYMLVIPYFIYSYSHNFYLDLALEQGIAGLALWVGITLLAAARLKSGPGRAPGGRESSLVSGAIYASLVILLTHGIADDPVYAGSWGLILLFALPGLAVSTIPESELAFVKSKAVLAGGALLAVIALGAGVVFFNPLRAAWQADLGAVRMSRLQLANWPTGEWETVEDARQYAPTAADFERALEANPANRTANYRLGLIRMGEQNFQDAVPYLERAYAVSPGHRGVRKTLGYCYVWLGEFDRAEALLQAFPEARPEMEAYRWWWQTQGRDDLSAKAGTMVERLSPTSQIQSEQ